MLTSRISGCKDSANRTKYQIYLGISEAQPIFCVREAVTKIVQPNEKANLFAFF